VMAGAHYAFEGRTELAPTKDIVPNVSDRGANP
jgi:hypothetical protein